MDDGFRAPRQLPRQAARLYAPLKRRSRARHHRRRRGLALLGLSLIAVVLALSLSASGHHGLRHPAAGAGRRLGSSAVLAGPGPRSFAVQELLAQDQAINRTLARTPFVRMAGAQHREIALTFDDGPGPYTPAILDILEREHVPGTFFEIGVLERYFHASTSRIVRDGFVIGDHTESHAAMSRLTPAVQKQQLLEDASVLGSYGAAFPRLFRPPYGMFNAATLKLLRRYRMLMVMWTVDTSDYRRPGAAAIVHSAVAGARPGAIVLMHDAGGNRSQTVKALPKIIAALRRRGYRLVTVPKLLLDNPAPRAQNLAALPAGGG